MVGSIIGVYQWESPQAEAAHSSAAVGSDDPDRSIQAYRDKGLIHIYREGKTPKALVQSEPLRRT